MINKIFLKKIIRNLIFQKFNFLNLKNNLNKIKEW